MSDLQSAISFNQAFGKVFNEGSFPLPVNNNSYNNTILDRINVESNGIRQFILNLAHSSSLGADGITPKLLKLTLSYSSDLFQLLFQQSLDQGLIPKDWKHTEVIPVFKSGDVSLPNNYRPISLTSILYKLLEHGIYTHLANYLLDTNSFSRTSTVSERIDLAKLNYEFITDIHENNHSRMQTVAIFVDFCRPIPAPMPTTKKD